MNDNNDLFRKEYQRERGREGSLGRQGRRVSATQLCIFVLYEHPHYQVWTWERRFLNSMVRHVLCYKLSCTTSGSLLGP